MVETGLHFVQSILFTVKQGAVQLVITSDGSIELFLSFHRAQALSFEHLSSTSMLTLQTSSIDHQRLSIMYCNASNSNLCKIDSPCFWLYC